MTIAGDGSTLYSFVYDGSIPLLRQVFPNGYSQSCEISGWDINNPDYAVLGTDGNFWFRNSKMQLCTAAFGDVTAAVVSNEYPFGIDRIAVTGTKKVVSSLMSPPQIVLSNYDGSDAEILAEGKPNSNESYGLSGAYSEDGVIHIFAQKGENLYQFITVDGTVVSSYGASYAIL